MILSHDRDMIQNILKVPVNHLECLGDKYQQATIISLITKYNNETQWKRCSNIKCTVSYQKEWIWILKFFFLFFLVSPRIASMNYAGHPVSGPLSQAPYIMTRSQNLFLFSLLWLQALEATVIVAIHSRSIKPYQCWNFLNLSIRKCQ